MDSPETLATLGTQDK